MSNDHPTEIPDLEDSNRMSNIQICMPTTPANLYALFRRQVRSQYRKPLIVVSPKKMLRHKLAVSELEDFVDGRVKRIIKETDSRITENP